MDMICRTEYSGHGGAEKVPSPKRKIPVYEILFSVNPARIGGGKDEVTRFSTRRGKNLHPRLVDQIDFVCAVAGSLVYPQDSSLGTTAKPAKTWESGSHAPLAAATAQAPSPGTARTTRDS